VRIIYILTIMALGICFMLFKKSEEKQNFIKWITIFIVTLLGYNVTICMILGLLKIVSYLWLLSIINLIFAFVLGYKAIKSKDYQKYYVRKQDIAGVLVFITIFMVLLIKDIKPFDGALKFAEMDAAIHYRAAEHFSENMMIFINVPDKTIFDFNVMQTGAYINDGILMNVVTGITGIEPCYSYLLFETLILFLAGLSLYVLVIDKIKTKMGFVATMMLIGLYIYSYPYNAYMYGFSYLSVGIVIATMMVIVVELLYEKVKINLPLTITLIALLAMGLIFSYCLYVPTIFAAICVYAFLKDLKEDGKTYLKIFKKETLIITGLLLLITIAGILYLVLPTFFIQSQENLVDALLNNGGIYRYDGVSRFSFYKIFALLYIIYLFYGEISKRERVSDNGESKITYTFSKRKIEFLDVFAISTGVLYGALVLGMKLGYVSDYYYYKSYNILWVAILAISITLVNKYIEKKVFPKIITAYVSGVVILVIGVIVLKTTPYLSPERKATIPNYVGIYYTENVHYRGLINSFRNFAKPEIEVVKFMRGIEDLTVDNITLISGSHNERAWTIAIGKLTSEKQSFGEIIYDDAEYTIQLGLDNPETKYIVRVNESYDLDEFEDKSGFDILFQNSRGYVLKKKELYDMLETRN